MQIAAFFPMGRTIAIVSNGTTLTSSNATVNLAGTGADNVFVVASAGLAVGLAPPSVVRVNNQGASPVFISFNQAARTAVVPVAGTPQLEFPVMPNTTETFSGLVWNGGGPGVPTTLIVATISVGLSQPLFLTFGEGM